MREREQANIRKVSNGYVVESECVTLVCRSLDELLTDVRAYFDGRRDELVEKFGLNMPISPQEVCKAPSVTLGDIGLR